MSYRELLLGCGYRRQRLLDPLQHRKPAEPPRDEDRWQQVTRVDINPDCKPDYVMDLEQGLATQERPANEDLFNVEPAGRRAVRWALKPNLFDEVHAYEVLEHLGRQGDVASFFAHFDAIYRVLKPGGFLCATVPSRYSVWLWGDPGHRRVIYPTSLLFLHRPHYDQACGSSPSSDYRPYFNCDFDLVYSYDNEETHAFILQAIKPARPPQC